MEINVKDIDDIITCEECGVLLNSNHLNKKRIVGESSDEEYEEFICPCCKTKWRIEDDYEEGEYITRG